MNLLLYLSEYFESFKMELCRRDQTWIGRLHILQYSSRESIFVWRLDNDVGLLHSNTYRKCNTMLKSVGSGKRYFCITITSG